MIRPDRKACPTRPAVAYAIAILRGWACLALGSVRVSTPSSRFAAISGRSLLCEEGERARIMADVIFRVDRLHVLVILGKVDTAVDPQKRRSRARR